MILVTGASSGVGNSVLRSLIHEGYDVLGTFYQCEPDNEIFVEKKNFKGWVRFRLEEVNSPADLISFVRDRRLGPISAVINCAGATKYQDPKKIFSEFTGEDLSKWLVYNVQAPYELIRLAYKEKDPRGQLSVINISSTAARTSVGSNMGYVMAKAALLNLATYLNANFHDVRVNTVSPSLMRTKLTKGFPDSYFKSVESEAATGELPTTDDIASAVLFLLTNQMVRNQNITVDNGIVKY